MDEASKKVYEAWKKKYGLDKPKSANKPRQIISTKNNALTTNTEESDKIFGRSFISRFINKALVGFHWVLLILTILLFFTGFWKSALVTLGIAVGFIYMSYRFAGGKRNPDIWKHKNLHDILKWAANTRRARVGFHSLRTCK